MIRFADLAGRVAAVALLLAFAARAAAQAYALDTPEATVTTLHSGLIALAEEAPGATVDERYAALEPLIAATHDLPYIAEFALRRQWSDLAEADRARFVEAFERLSIMTYAARFANVGPQAFKPVSVAPPDGARTLVSTAIARPGDSDVTLEYLLQHGAEGWRIVNIVADGVSDLALKRAEYQRLLAAGSIDTLIAELGAQAERLRGN
jgi:phospholipid transport system substrate-binding protein